jgi:hydrogenase/urease accessory protein HupE
MAAGIRRSTSYAALVALGLVMLVASPAAAHGDEPLDSVGSGLWHTMTQADHLLMVLAVVTIAALVFLAVRRRVASANLARVRVRDERRGVDHVERGSRHSS